MAAVHVSLGGRDSARRVEEAEETVTELLTEALPPRPAAEA